MWPYASQYTSARSGGARNYGPSEEYRQLLVDLTWTEIVRLRQNDTAIGFSNTDIHFSTTNSAQFFLQNLLHQLRICLAARCLH